MRQLVIDFPQEIVFDKRGGEGAGILGERRTNEDGSLLVLKRAFAGPVCFAWPAEDEFFPLASARRFAGELADGAVSVIEDSRAFTPEDNPQALARVIAAVAAQARAPA